MSTIDASELLRPGLLNGVSIVLAGAPAGEQAPASPGAAVRAACAGLGARVCECELGIELPAGESESTEEGQSADERAAGEAVQRALADGGSVELLVVDGASLFARARNARTALLACLESSWNVTRAVANAAFLPQARGGRIVFVAPPADTGQHADAARAGLENLARTLSIEWARHSVTAVAIAPGAAEGAERSVAALTAYLASPAGAYFSGCVLDLSGAGAT